MIRSLQLKLFIISTFFALISNAQIQITNVTTTGETCFSQCDGTITIDVAGASGPVAYSLNGVVQTVGVYTNLCPGSYDIIVTDGMTSDAQNGVVVSAYAAMNAVLTTVDETYAGFCDGMAMLNITGGVPPYTITWYDASFNIIMSGSSSVIVPLCAGNYHYQVTDNSTCFGINPIIMFTIGSQFQQLLYTTQVTQPLCNGDCNGSIGFNAIGGAGGYEYSVNGGMSYASTPLVGGLCAGTYNTQVRDQNGLVVSNGSVTLTAPDPLVATIFNATAATCANVCDGTAMLMASGGTPPYSYIHPSTGLPEPFSSAAMINGACAGSWSVMVSDVNACLAPPLPLNVSSPSPIVVMAQVDLDASSSTACDGALSANVTGGTPGYVVYWKECASGSIAHTPPAPTTVCAGSYYAFVSDNIGCVDSSSCVTVSFTSNVDNLVSQNIKAWPNPTNQMLYLELNSQSTQAIVEIMDAAGRKVHQGVLVNGTNAIDMKALAQSSGLYLVKVSTETGMQVLRVVLE